MNRSGRSFLDGSRSHGNLVAAIDRRIVDGRNTHYRSPVPSSALSVPKEDDVPRSPLQSGKMFFAECRTRLDPGTYSKFIADIKGLKVSKITREDVLTNAAALFSSENSDLVDKLKELLLRPRRTDFLVCARAHTQPA